jgi:hypothetical protein
MQTRKTRAVDLSQNLQVMIKVDKETKASRLLGTEYTINRIRKYHLRQGNRHGVNGARRYRDTVHASKTGG